MAPLLFLRLVGEPRQRPQVSDQRVQILSRQLAGGVADDLRHRLGRQVTVGVDAGGQEVLQVAVTQLLQPRRGEIRDILGVRSLPAGELAILLRGTEEVARRMALAAMSQSLHEVGAAIENFRRARRAGEPSWREEEPLPWEHEDAKPEREAQFVRMVRARARRQRAQVGPQIANVVVRDLREGRIGEGGKVGPPVRARPFLHRAEEISLGPAANAALWIWRDVRSVESPEWRGQRPAAGVGDRVGLLLRMATDAIAHLREIGAAPSVLRVRAARAGEQKEGAEDPLVDHGAMRKTKAPPERGFLRSIFR